MDAKHDMEEELLFQLMRPGWFASFEYAVKLLLYMLIASMLGLFVVPFSVMWKVWAGDIGLILLICIVYARLRLRFIRKMRTGSL